MKVSVLVAAVAVVAATACTDGADQAEGGGDPTPSGRTDTQAFCEQARSLEGDIQVDPERPDPAEIERAAEGLGQLSALAPGDIRPQVDSARRIMQEFSDLLAGVDVSDPASISSPEFQGRLAELQELDATLGADLGELARFIEVECDVSVADGATDDGVTEPGAAGQGVDGADGTGTSERGRR